MLARTAPLALRATSAWASSRVILGSGAQGFAADAAAATDRVVDIESDAEFQTKLQEVKDKGSLAVVDFTAKWCGPCRMIAPKYKELSSKYPTATFLKVDIDNPSVSTTVRDHNITGVPTFIYYKGGRRVEGFSGARPELLEEFVKKHK